MRKLPELFDEQFDGGVVVAVWFDYVVEGVDMWFSDDHSKDIPKFRMKMRVKHGDNVVVFAVFDKDVQKLAIETCPLMLSMVTSVCNEVGVVNMFFDEYIPDIDNHIEGMKDESLKDLIKDEVVYHSSCGSKEATNCDDVSSLSSKIVNEKCTSLDFLICLT
ncbi:hypothetical protein TSUD_91150 [Trifolium subterraneum]|uniref:DUF223 domain-containing protein n=1 Tax=Trifolium subterraneum TaxID=3900 RepID=A0A2Z6PT97_TRISU|nr:hypothetical protein TSUD_91150 [Trifolium subterraneum]